MTGDQQLPAWTRGTRLAVDVGEARIGVAKCDPDGILSSPVETVQRRSSPEEGLKRLGEIVQEWEACVVYVGYPLTLSGSEGLAASRIAEYAGRIAGRLPGVPVYLVDERLTTVSAHRSLHEAGVRGRQHRQIVDQAAAVALLETAVAQEKANGSPPGTLVAP